MDELQKIIRREKLITYMGKILDIPYCYLNALHEIGLLDDRTINRFLATRDFHYLSDKTTLTEASVIIGNRYSYSDRFVYSLMDEYYYYIHGNYDYDDEKYDVYLKGLCEIIECNYDYLLKLFNYGVLKLKTIKKILMANIYEHRPKDLNNPIYDFKNINVKQLASNNPNYITKQNFLCYA